MVDLNKTPVSYVNAKIKQLTKEKRSLQIKYTLFSLLSFFLNMATIVLSIVCIVRLAGHSKDDLTAVVLSALSAGLIVVLFTLNVINVVFRGIFKTNTYRQALFAMQAETSQYKYNQNAYRKIETKEEKEKLYLKNVKKIHKNALKAKKKVKFRQILRAVYRGTYV